PPGNSMPVWWDVICVVASIKAGICILLSFRHDFLRLLISLIGRWILQYNVWQAMFVPRQGRGWMSLRRLKHWRAIFYVVPPVGLQTPPMSKHGLGWVNQSRSEEHTSELQSR